MTLIKFCLLCFLVVAFIGCGTEPSAQYVGVWIGHRAVVSQPGEDPSIANTASLIQLTIDRTGRFQLIDGGVSKSGSYQQSSDHGNLNVELILNQAIERQTAEVKMENSQLTVTLQPNGDLAYESGVTHSKVLLHRLKAGESWIAPIPSGTAS